MYRRYSQGNPGSVSISQMKRSRLKDLIILVLAALLIAGAVFCIPLLQKQDAPVSEFQRAGAVFVKNDFKSVFRPEFL